MKELFLLRGLPGAGKSTLAKSLGGNHYEADQYFVQGLDNVYTFDASKLKDAHEWCKNLVAMAMMQDSERIVVSNTFTQEWEMAAYNELAKEFGYIVFTLIVENRHNGINQHNVPVEAIQRMKQRFNVKL